MAAAAANRAGAETEQRTVYLTLSGDDLRNLMESQGYRVRLVPQTNGNPMLQTAAEGLSFTIFFYDCRPSEPRRCRSIGFSAGFRLPAPVDADLVADWNRRRRFGVAFSEDDSAYLSLNVNVDGGITAENLLDTLALWEDSLVDYVDYIGWR